MTILKEGDIEVPAEELVPMLLSFKAKEIVVCHDVDLDYWCLLSTDRGLIGYVGTREKFAVWLQEEGPAQ